MLVTDGSEGLGERQYFMLKVRASLMRKVSLRPKGFHSLTKSFSALNIRNNNMDDIKDLENLSHLIAVDSQLVHVKVRREKSD